MYTALITAFEALKATPGLSEESIWPLAAPGDVEGMFVTYRVDEGQAVTKNGINDDVLVIGVFDTQYLSVAQLADSIKEQILNTTGVRFYYQGCTGEYSNDLERAFVSMNFTFKHK